MSAAHRTPRGAAPVGHVADLDPIEAGAVRCLRLWCEAEGPQSLVKGDFTASLGPEAGGLAAETFSELCALCVRYGRRPLMHHATGCACVGADEACFARLVGAAGAGEREDAMLIATLLVRPDVAPGLAILAERIGLCLRRAAMTASGPAIRGALH